MLEKRSAQICMWKAPVARSDNKTTEEEEEAGRGESAASFNNIMEKSENENAAYRYEAN